MTGPIGFLYTCAQVDSAAIVPTTGGSALHQGTSPLSDGREAHARRRSTGERTALRRLRAGAAAAPPRWVVSPGLAQLADSHPPAVPHLWHEVDLRAQLFGMCVDSGEGGSGEGSGQGSGEGGESSPQQPAPHAASVSGE